MAINTAGFDGPPEVKPEVTIFDWADRPFASAPLPADFALLDVQFPTYAQSYCGPSSPIYGPFPQAAPAASSSCDAFFPPAIKEPDQRLLENSLDPLLPTFPTSVTLGVEYSDPIPAQHNTDVANSNPSTIPYAADENDRLEGIDPTKPRVSFRLARCSKAQKACMRDVLQREIRYGVRAFNGEFSAALVAAALEQIHTERLQGRGGSQDVLHRFSKDQQRKLRLKVAESPKNAKRAMQSRKIAMTSNEDIDRALLALRKGLVGWEEEGLLEQEEFQEDLPEPEASQEKSK